MLEVATPTPDPIEIVVDGSSSPSRTRICQPPLGGGSAGRDITAERDQHTAAERGSYEFGAAISSECLGGRSQVKYYSHGQIQHPVVK
ncbi:hypothetical protein BJI47_22980 [Rhodococcus sp. 1168]|nr:hypothetical protein BJI47_22980 [Rhodococcus sp. 1168]